MPCCDLSEQLCKYSSGSGSPGRQARLRNSHLSASAISLWCLNVIERTDDFFASHEFHRELAIGLLLTPGLFSHTIDADLITPIQKRSI